MTLTYSSRRSVRFNSTSPDAVGLASECLQAAAWTSGGPFSYRTVIDFDFNGLGPGATITGATATLHSDDSCRLNTAPDHTSSFISFGTASNALHFHDVESEWSASSATWSTIAIPDEAAIATTAEFNQDPVPSPLDTLSVDLTSWSEAVQASGSGSHGLLVKLQTETAYAQIGAVSLHHNAGEKHPVLTVEASLPCERVSPWYNVDEPSGAGDYEDPSTMAGVCANRLGAEVQTADGAPLSSTGEFVRVVAASNDLVAQCRNDAQADGTCDNDYRVRFVCAP